MQHIRMQIMGIEQNLIAKRYILDSSSKIVSSSVFFLILTVETVLRDDSSFEIMHDPLQFE